MPDFLVLFLLPNPFVDDGDVPADIKDDPLVRKAIDEMAVWMETELKAQRIKNSGALLDSAADTDVRVNFHSPDKPPTETAEGIILPLPRSSVLRQTQQNVSSSIRNYFLVTFPDIEDVIAWAQSCPVSYDGFAMEIRKLQDIGDILHEMDADTSDRVGDLVVSQRKQMMEEGKMKRDQDGTLWAKVDDVEDDRTREVIEKAEERVNRQAT